MNWKVAAIGPALGARVRGVDTARLDDPEVRTTLADLLDRYHVVAIEGAALGPADQIDLGRHFGDPYLHPHLEAVDGYPELLVVDKQPDEHETFGGEYWHADITFERPPAAVSLLQAALLPPAGGDTLFANQHLACEALPADMRRAVEGRSAVHLYPGMTEGEPHSTAVHPVIRRHRSTGREALFVNPAFTIRFADSTVEESAPLLAALFEHQVADEFVERLSWTADMLALWDNRSVLHYATNDYAGFRRTLRRVTAMERP